MGKFSTFSIFDQLATKASTGTWPGALSCVIDKDIFVQLGSRVQGQLVMFQTISLPDNNLETLCLAIRFRRL